MTADDITPKLLKWASNFGRRFVLPNVHVIGSPWESDVVSVTAAYYWSEFEIKISVADYRADLQKVDCSYANNPTNKHEAYAAAGPIQKRWSDIPKPKHFWFVTPPGLLHGIDVPEHCGIVECHTGLRVVRQAPKLKHATKLDQKAIYNLAVKAADRYRIARREASR